MYMSRWKGDVMDEKKNGVPLSETEIERYSEVLKSLANPARLRIVNTLIKGEWTVSEICELTGLKQSLVSQQLKNLRLNNIVERRKDVPKVYYRLKEKNVISMLKCLSRCGIDQASDRRNAG
jgi:DNA-binding transcriptional ArsR family regulator